MVGEDRHRILNLNKELEVLYGDKKERTTVSRGNLLIHSGFSPRGNNTVKDAYLKFLEEAGIAELDKRISSRKNPVYIVNFVKLRAYCNGSP